jgi:hypothetical protein
LALGAGGVPAVARAYTSAAAATSSTATPTLLKSVISSASPW